MLMISEKLSVGVLPSKYFVSTVKMLPRNKNTVTVDKEKNVNLSLYGAIIVDGSPTISNAENIVTQKV